RRTVEFVEQTFALQRRGLFDAYQLHYYEPWSDLAQVLAYIRSGIGSTLPIEGWEVGVAWPGSSYNEREHAAETAKLLATLLAAGVQRAIYLPLAPGEGANPETGGRGELWRGLYLGDGTARPAAAVYQTLVDAAKRPGARWRSLPAARLRGVAFGAGASTTI